jgi:hypothetical protein
MLIRYEIVLVNRLYKVFGQFNLFILNKLKQLEIGCVHVNLT